MSPSGLLSSRHVKIFAVGPFFAADKKPVELSAPKSLLLDQGPAKSESGGAFYMILMRSWSRAGEALSAQQ